MAVPGWRKQAVQFPTFGLDDLPSPSAFRTVGMAEIQHLQDTIYSTLLVEDQHTLTPSHPHTIHYVALRCVALHCIAYIG